MSKKLTRILSLCLCLIAVLSVFSGCTPEQTIAPAENTYSAKYSLSTAEQSPDITIDGVLDEAVWQDKVWFTNTYASSDGTYPVVKYTAFPTKYGVYIASVVTDRNLTSDGQRYPHVSTHWEMYLAACDVGEDLTDPEHNGYWNMHRIYVNLQGESMSLYTNTERAVVLDGEVNTNNSNGATLELLVPWEVLQVDTSLGIPEYVGISPWYRAVLMPGAATTYMHPAGANMNSPATYHYFDKNGYTAADREGAVLGNAKNGYSKSAGWDISQEENGIVTSQRGGHGYIFFSEECGENFVVEATLIPVQAVNDDWPKAGITFQKTDGLYYNIMLDAGGKDGLVDSINGTKNFPSYQLVTYDQHDSNWNQTALSGYDTTNPNASAQEGVKLMVVKYGNQFWYFADGKYLTSETVSWMDGECYPGFFTLGFEVIYKDYSCQEIDLDGLKEYLELGGMSVVETQAGEGGEVTVSSTSVSAGGSYEVSFVTESGYQLSSVTVNGKEMIDDVRQNAKDGVYTVTDVREHQNIVVTFQKIEGVTYSGTITDGEQTLRGDVVLISQTDGSAYYTERSAGSRGFEFHVLAGTYEVRVQVDDGQWQSKIVELIADMEDEILYTAVPEAAEN